MNGTNWRDFIDSIREVGTYRNRIKSLDSDIADYLDTGPQKKGGYKNKRANFKGKKFNDISAPPGAVGGLEEETVEPETFEKQQTLNEKFWKGPDHRLNEKIRRRLIKIAADFIDNIDVDVMIEDIRFTGSLANYNWSKYSDIDLHLVVDFSKIDEDTDLVKSFFDAARMRWNDLHDIKIHNFEVEIYIENVGDPHRSSGVYSITQNEWIVEPDPANVDIDIALARKKSDDIETQVNLIGHILEKNNYRSALRAIERLKDKIGRMRKAGLHSAQQEFSPENIAFKILRREKVLQKLTDMKYGAYDKMMSI